MDKPQDLIALEAIIGALLTLDDEERIRVLDYIHDRFRRNRVARCESEHNGLRCALASGHVAREHRVGRDEALWTWADEE